MRTFGSVGQRGSVNELQPSALMIRHESVVGPDSGTDGPKCHRLRERTEAEGGHPIPNSNSHARTRNGPTSSKIAIII